MAATLAQLGFDIKTNEIKQATKSLDKLSKTSNKVEKSQLGVGKAAKFAAGALSALGAASAVRAIFNTVRSTEALQASLKTMTGSTESAQAAFNDLIGFAKTTPFTLDQSVNGFIKMKALGLDPTTEAMKAFGNTSAAMGKSLTQMIDAVAAASTGEFERLKEFGIKSKREGDNVILTFQGVETNIKNNSKAIVGYLEDIGNTKFAGAMEDQMNTVNGALSNLEDQIDSLYRTVGGDGSAFKGLIDGASSAVFEITGLASALNGSIDEFSSVNKLTGEQSVQLQMNADAARALAHGITAVGAAYTVFSIATNRAAIAQVAFNIAARANPYALIATTALAAGVAVYSFMSAQKSARQVWEDATESEAAYRSASANNTGANRINEIRNESAELQKSLAKTFDGSKRQRQLQSKLNTLANEYRQITDARKAAEKAQTARQAVADEEKRKAKQSEIDLEKVASDAKAAAAKAEIDAQTAIYEAARKSVYGKLDLVLTEKEGYADLIAEIVSLGLTTNEQTRLIELAAKKHKAAMDELGGDSGNKTGDEFLRSFESSTANIANSLQDAIASGQWAGLGATIGGALAGGIAASVSDQITGAGFGSLASGLGGAVAGGLVGLAIQQLNAGDNFDPSSSRQASQGTGTVLGSLNEKTRSIEKASDITASATTELIGINRSMLNAMERVNAGIVGVSARVAMSSGFTGRNPGIGQGSAFNSLSSANLEMSSTPNFGIVDLLTTLGGSSKKKDEGVEIIGGFIGDLIDETIVDAYATFRVKKNFYSSSKTKEKTSGLGDDISNQFSLVFESVLDSVLAGAATFGLDASAADNFKVETQKISLDGMSPQDKQQAYEDYFSTVFDELSTHVLPFITDFQMAGEGFGETLARVSTNIQVAEEAVKQLGFEFASLSGKDLAAASTQLIELTGGVEQFISSMSGFISNFASEAEQFRISQESINSALSQANLELPQTRDGYFDLLRAQDGSTKAGAENIATLLRLQSSASNYYDTLEEGAERAMESARSAASANLAQSQSAADAVDNALKGLSSVDNAQSRESALASIQSMTAAGRVGSTRDLQGTLSAATSISASDFATFNEYVRTVSRTGAAIGGLKQITDAKVTKDQQLLSNIEKEIAAMSKEIIELNKANVKQTAKSARILERIEVGGVRIIA
jgi:hypothetical protein